MTLPLVLVLGCVASAISYNQRMLDPLTALIARELLVDPGLVVMLSPAFSLPYALAQPLLGPLSDSIGKAAVIRTCAIVAALATVVSYFITSYEALFVLRMVTGVAAGGVLPVSLALIADRTPQDQRQVALSRFMITIVLAQIFTSPLSAAIAQTYSWHASLLVCIVLGIFGIGLMIWQIRPNPAAVRTPFSPRRVMETYRTIAGFRRARICYAIVLVEGMMVFGFTPHVALFLEGQKLGSVTEAGYVLGGMGIGGLLYGLTVSAIVRRFSLHTMMNAGGVLIATGFLTVIAASSWPVISLAYSFIGFGFYMLHSGIQTEVTEVYPPARGAVVSLHAFFLFFGMSSGPILVGLLSGPLGYRPILALCATGLCLGVFAATTLLGRLKT